MHFIGGVSIGQAGKAFFAGLQRRKLMDTLPWSLLLFVLFSVVGLAAATWELFEFGIGQFFHVDLQGNLFDTMMDIFFGLLGGFTAALFFVLFSSHRGDTKAQRS